MAAMTNPDAAREAAWERVIQAAWTFGGPNRGPSGKTSLEITTKALAAFEDFIWNRGYDAGRAERDP
jgi:hypothetical protein